MLLLQAALLEERDLGVLLSLVTLLLGVVSRSYEGFDALVPRVVKILHRLNPERERDAAGHTVVDRVSVPPEYQYYGIPSPWLQVRCMPCVQRGLEFPGWQHSVTPKLCVQSEGAILADA